ncbi:Fibronectin type III domain protein [compost metagenome]
MRKITLFFLMSLFSMSAYAQLPLEGFETWPPEDWIISDNGVGPTYSWSQTNGTEFQPAYEGDHAAYINREAVIGIAEDWLITKEFTVPNSAELTFYSRLGFNLDNGTTYRVMIINADDDPSDFANFHEVKHWTELEINYIQLEYLRQKVSIPAEYSGTNVRLAFVMAGNNGDRWLIDNVKVAEACLIPVNLTSTEVGLTTAKLNWDNPSGSTSWQIEVLPVGTPATGVGELYTGTLPFLAEDLEQNTEYRYYVRSVCGDEISDISEPHFFKTISPGYNCYAPIMINSTPYSTIDNTSNYVDYYEGVPGEDCGNATGINFFNGNDVVYQYTASFTGSISIDLVNATNNVGLFVYNDCDDIGNLCAAGGATPWFGSTSFSIPEFEVESGENYYIVISSQNQTTPYTLVIQQVTCTPPTGLPVTGADYTSAKLSWTNPTAATDWEVVVQAPQTGIPASSGIPADTNTNFLVDELDPATPYEYYVRSDCGDGTFSPWAGPYLFNTTICEPSEQCEYTFVLFNTVGNNGNESEMTVSQNGITVATLELPDDAGPKYITVPLCKEKPFELFWTKGGYTPDDMGVTILNPFGQQIYTMTNGTPDTMLYEGVVDCDAVSCITPSILTATNPTLTSINLGWDGAPTGNWEYYIVDAGDEEPIETTEGIATTTNPVTANDLDPAKNYDFYVRMVCDDAPTNWSESHPFSTAICTPEEQCEYKFIMVSDGSGWMGNTMTISQNGINVAVIGADFTFGQGPVEVSVPLCSGEPFELFWNHTGSASFLVGISIINPMGQTLYNMPFNGADQGEILYAGTADCENPACIPPAGLSALNPTMTTADLVWDTIEGASWEYYVTEAGNPAPTTDTEGEITNVTPATADELTAATNYEYYVRLLCTNNDKSEWAGPFAFNTTVCEPSEQCAYVFEMTSELGWGWEGNTMTILQDGIVITTIGGDFSTGLSSTVTVSLCPDIPTEIFWNDNGWNNSDKGLTVYTSYMEDFFAKPAGTGAKNTTIFNGVLSCTAPLCIKPQELTASDFTSESAILEWTEMGAATDWEIWVLPANSPEPTTEGTSASSPYLAEDLTPGTPYEFYVRANCGDENGFSNWAGPFVFATVVTNNTCSDATEVPVNPGTECIEHVSGVLNGAIASGVISDCTWTTPLADVWYSFTATSDTHTIQLTNFKGGITPFHSIYTGECDALTELYCGWDAGGTTLSNLTIGETYWVQIYIDGGMPEMPADIVSFDICVITPGASSIIINPDLYTVEQIVTDILVNLECGQVNNITSRTGTDFGIESNGISYFHRGATDFPLEEGILLTTGKAIQAKGPNNTVLGDGDWWPGDDQLFNFVQESGINPFLLSLNQASVVEFDFVAVSDKLRFPFIFASDEYSINQCFMSDAFAFFLTDEDGNVSNLAVIPDTNTPVSVVTIRDEAYVDPGWGFPCPSVNAALFDRSYGPFGPGLDPMTSPTNFNGFTKIMYAEAEVVPGQTYHLKMVVADDLDTGADSGVFIGKFDIGNVDLGIDLTIEDGNAICAGETTTLESGLSPDEYSFEWSRNGEVIPGQTDPDLIVSQSGEYTLTVQYGATSCEGSDSVSIAFYAPVEETTGDPSDMFVCDPDGFATFDLSQNTTAILAGLNAADYEVSYHLSDTAARENSGALDLSYENETQFSQVLYVRIYNTITGCYGIKSFSLSVQDLTPQFEITDDLLICEGTSATISIEPGNFDPEEVTYSWTFNDEALPDTTSAITVTLAGVYEVTINNSGCTATASITVTTAPAPIADDPDDVTNCNSYILPALSASNNYYTATGATGTLLSAGDVITNTQTVYVYTQIGTAPNTCSDENSFIVTIITTPEVTVTQGCDGNDFTLKSIITDGIYSPEDVTFEWENSSGIVAGTSPTLIITTPDTYILRVTPIGDTECPVEVETIVASTTCEIPRGISPNGDGLNDELNLEGMNIRKLSIFNRYGQEVYSRNNYTKEWHGQGNNGDELPTATYYYTIELENGQSKTGWVYINREE